jgi:DNA repair protein RadA/Sms
MKLKVNKAADLKFGTNVLDIEVPEILRERFKTGIDYIDGALGGQGFTPSTVTLFTGEPGAGKTTMMLHLADRITKCGGISLFNTAEESLYQTALTAQRLKLRNGFSTGNLADVYKLLKEARSMMEAAPEKRFFLIIDSLQCLFDPKYKGGESITNAGAIRALALITEFCKETNAIGIVIGQVTKGGQMAGSNKLKHMVDSLMHLSVEKKDADLIGCRVLETYKNRFGGCGHVFFMHLGKRGFRTVAKVSNG